MPPTSRAVRDQERVCGSGPPERPLIDGQISYLNTALALIAPGNSIMPASSTISGGSAAVRPALTKFRSRLVLTHHWARMGQGKFRELLGRRAEVSEAAGSGADAGLEGELISPIGNEPALANAAPVKLMVARVFSRPCLASFGRGSRTL